MQELGSAQIAVLKHVATFPERSIGTEVAQDLTKRLKRPVLLGQSYTVLRRLEEMGLVKPRMTKRGKFYTVTAVGRKTLE